MYLSYYNLKSKPFQMSTDPAFLWLGEKHKEALAVLKYAILENKGVLALTGDVGTGKTTLINALLNSLGEDTVSATIYDPRLNLIDFFNTITTAFKMEGEFDGKGQFLIQFMDFLIKTHEQNQRILLIIDEAQAINEDLLEEIRLLSNLEAEYTRLLNIFFVGQTEFVDILQKYENRALRQRVSIRYHIDPLTLKETAEYIKYRLKVSGGTAHIFSSGAIDEIYIFSNGYPRLINIMCDHALLSGYVREFQVINASLIRECREELLVSKKTSEKDIQYTADNHQSYLEERMLNEPSPNPFAPTEDTPPSPFTPMEDTQPSPFTPVDDGPPNLFTSMEDTPPSPFAPEDEPYIHEDEHMVFGPAHTMGEPGRSRRPPKKSFFRSPLAIAFILLMGVAAGYFFYGNGQDTTESFATSAQQQSGKYLSDKLESKNDQSPVVQPVPKTSDIPGRVETDSEKDSRFFMAKSMDSGLPDKTAPNEAEIPQDRPSDQLIEEDIKQEQADTTKPSDLESDSFNKAMENGMADASKNSSENSLETGMPEETAPTTTNPPDTAGSDATQKLPIIAPITEKTPGKIETLPQIPSKAGSAPLTTVAGSSDIVKRESKTAKPKAKHSEIGNLASKPAKKPEPAKRIAKPARVKKKPIENYKTKPADKTVASLNVPARKSEQETRKNYDYTNLPIRLREFLNKYCRTYEQKNLDKFSSLFASDAIEQGKPFRSWHSKYRQNFNKIDLIKYSIKLERYATQKEAGLIKVDGRYNVRAKLNGSDRWRASSGDISMVLEMDDNSFKVLELDY
jgi:type II secretory pathway predicted ATPase ExeA